MASADPNGQTFHQLLSKDKPLVLPGVYDAFSAKLAEKAGFDAGVVGGFSLVGSRYGLPDIGLVGFGEMAAGVRDILSASNLALLIDCDDGYGDLKNVTRTVQTYEQMGAAAIFIEDQVSPKRCGHVAGKDVVPSEVMESKIRAAAAARNSEALFIIARTDARGVNGLDDALRRCERNIAAGADGVFVEAPESLEELEIIGKAFDVPQMANMLAGGLTPILSNQELYDMGFQVIVHGTTLIKRVAKVLQQTLDSLRRDELDINPEQFISLDECIDMLDIKRWQDVED